MTSTALQTKRCTKCGEEKPLEAFRSAPRNRDGYTGQCKMCISDHARVARQLRVVEVKTTGDKRCSHCKQFKPVSAFFRNRAMKDGLNNYCKQCHTARQKKPDKSVVRDWHLRRTFGITLEDEQALLIAQGGKCAICGTTDPGRQGTFHVDHDHKTGCVRGLLCNNCNRGIGHLQDDPFILEAAANYLRRFHNEKGDQHH